MAEINKVQLLIRSFLWETKDIVKNADECKSWLESFRETLEFQDLCQNPMPFAIELINEAKRFSDKQREKVNKRWHPELIEEPKEESSKQIKKAPTAKIPLPNGKTEVIDFARSNGIPSWAVDTWYVQNFVERPGCDKEGITIENWKGALVNYAKREKSKDEARRTEADND